MLQNHLLQLLALTAMEEPVEFAAEAIRTEKLKVLRRDLAARATWSATPSAASTTRAGWPASGRVGYRDEEGVPADSTTETYAAVRLGVETRRWAGVPFYLRTGKRLPRRVTEIARVVQEGAAPAVRRRPTPRSSATTSSSSGCSPTRASRCKFGSKVPGTRDGGPRRRRWTSSTARRSPSPPPRPTSGCILDVLLGDATLFPRNAEVEASWRVIDPLEEFWAGTHAATRTAPASGARRPPTRCSPRDGRRRP